jgi:hypothetical protein
MPLCFAEYTIYVSNAFGHATRAVSETHLRGHCWTTLRQQQRAVPHGAVLATNYVLSINQSTGCTSCIAVVRTACVGVGCDCTNPLYRRFNFRFGCQLRGTSGQSHPRHVCRTTRVQDSGKRGCERTRGRPPDGRWEEESVSPSPSRFNSL